MASNLIPENFEYKRNALAHIERCFVIGNGPTLNKYNLEALNNELTFGCNKIFLTGFTPDFLGIMDGRALGDSIWNDLPDKKCRLVTTPGLKEGILNKFGKTFYPIKTVNHMLNKKVYEYNQLWYGDFETIKSSFSILGDFPLPLAIYLGIKNIYLLGIDWFWTAPQGYLKHAYKEPARKVQLWDIDVPAKEIFCATMAKLDLLASQMGVQIFNASPGSPVICFRRVAPKDLPVNLSITYDTKNSIGKYIVMLDRIYKIVPSIIGDNNAISLMDIGTRKFISWIPGPWHTPRMHMIEDIKGCERPFIENSSFLPETGFTDKNNISISTLDKNYYIVKHPYEERYSMQPFTGEFDAALSSFKLYDSLSEALSVLKQTSGIQASNVYDECMIRIMEIEINDYTKTIPDLVHKEYGDKHYIFTYHNSCLSYDPQKNNFYHGNIPEHFITYLIKDNKICLNYANKYINFDKDSKKFNLSENIQFFEVLYHNSDYITIKLNGRQITTKPISIIIDNNLYLTAWKDGNMIVMDHCLAWEKFYI